MSRQRTSARPAAARAARSRLTAGTLAAAGLLTLGAAACGTAAPPGAGQSSRPATSAPGVTTPVTTPPPQSCPGGWRSGPVTVSRTVTVPPVPVASAIRTGSHPGCRFDRLVIDIDRVPGYRVRFVPRVVHDGSGLPITMPGSSYLEIMLAPAQGHRAGGTPTLPSGVRMVGYPMLRAFTVAGDYEGHLTVALGLAAQARYRVGALPGRVYVDVAW